MQLIKNIREQEPNAKQVEQEDYTRRYLAAKLFAADDSGQRGIILSVCMVRVILTAMQRCQQPQRAATA